MLSITTLLVNVAASTARMFTARGPARCHPSQRARWRTNRLKTFTASREKSRYAPEARMR